MKLTSQEWIDVGTSSRVYPRLSIIPWPSGEPLHSSLSPSSIPTILHSLCCCPFCCPHLQKDHEWPLDLTELLHVLVSLQWKHWTLTFYIFSPASPLAVSLVHGLCCWTFREQKAFSLTEHIMGVYQRGHFTEKVGQGLRKGEEGRGTGVREEGGAGGGEAGGREGVSFRVLSQQVYLYIVWSLVGKKTLCSCSTKMSLKKLAWQWAVTTFNNFSKETNSH